MTALPTSAGFTEATVTEAQFKNRMSELRDYLAGLFGAAGTVDVALASLGALAAAVAEKTAAYTVVATDRGKVLSCSGAWTLALPAVAIVGAGFSCVVVNRGSGTVTIDPDGTELINGVATMALLPGHGGLLICTGAAWISVGVFGNETVAHADGTAAAPSVSFGQDSDTGLYRTAANSLGLSTGGALRARVHNGGLEVTGAMTGTAVTQSATDATAGRLMKVGDFGLGAAIPTNLTDLTQAILPGTYRIDDLATLIGGPAGPTGQGTLIATRGSDGRGTFLLSLPVTTAAAQRFWFGSRSVVTGAITWSESYGSHNLAVTQSATDATAGRLLKVGDFGLGASIPTDLTDLTAAILPGVYRIGNLATVIGGPAGATGQGTLIATRGSDGRGTFLLSLPVATAAAQRFWHGSRSIAGGTITWSLSVTFDRLLGAVSQTAGVPTGAVFQIGSSASGRFERRASGQMRCLRTDLAVTDMNIAYGAGFRSADISWTFPSAFLTGSLPVISINGAHSDVTGFRIITISDTAVTLQLTGLVAITGAITLRAAAEGRWSDMV